MNWLKSFWKKLTGSTPAGASPFLDETIVNFTPRAQQALALARREADRLHHHYIGTEHLLLGLIKLGQGVAFNVLQQMGLDLETVRMAVEKVAGTDPASKVDGNVLYAPRVKMGLALASKEAKNLHHNYVGTEHILLGLLREGNGTAARVLKQFNVDLVQTRNDILKELDPIFLPGGNEPEIHASELARAEALLSAQGNFTPRARQVLELARLEADRL